MADSRGLRLPFQDAFEHFTIDPQTNWARFYNPQFFVSVNAGDVEIENDILRQLGSYGKQLGRLRDALKVVVARIPREGLTPHERRALEDFDAFSRGVEDIVADHRGGRTDTITAADVDRVVDGVRSLARSDPEAYRVLVARLRAALSERDGKAAPSSPRDT